MEVVKHMNLIEMNKIHFVHNYLDRGWQVHIQKSKGKPGSTIHNKNRLIIKNMKGRECSSFNQQHRTNRIILSDDVNPPIGNGLTSLDETWLKENKRIVCIYSFLHNTLRKGWIIKKEISESGSNKEEGSYCFSKPHKNQVKYLTQTYLQNFIVDNVNDDLENVF